jgi:hypothetical protein
MQNKQHIHCSVNNCHYWGQGNKCDAEEILVTSDAIGAAYPDDFDCKQSNQLSPTPVDNCMSSCCKTFVPQNSDKIMADKVKKL